MSFLVKQLVLCPAKTPFSIVSIRLTGHDCSTSIYTIHAIRPKVNILYLRIAKLYGELKMATYKLGQVIESIGAMKRNFPTKIQPDFVPLLFSIYHQEEPRLISKEILSEEVGLNFFGLARIFDPSRGR